MYRIQFDNIYASSAIVQNQLVQLLLQQFQGGQGQSAAQAQAQQESMSPQLQGSQQALLNLNAALQQQQAQQAAVSAMLDGNNNNGGNDNGAGN